MAKNEVRVTLIADDKGLTSGIKGAGTTVDSFSNTLRTKLASALDNVSQKFPAVGKVAQKFGLDAGSALGAAVPTAAAAAGTAIAGFAAKSIGDFQDAAQEVLHYKQIAGGTAEDASRWVAAFDDYGISADQASTLVGKLAKVAETSPDSLEKYGASIVHAKDGSIDLNGTLLNVIDTLHNAPDASSKAALGTAAFGKGWQDMAKVIDAGASEIKTSFDSVSGGQIFSDEDLQNSEDFRLALDNLGDAIQGLENSIGSAAIPVLTDLINVITNLKEATEEVPGPLLKVAETAAKFNPIVLPFTAAKKALDFFGESAEKDVVAIGKLDKVTHEVVGSAEDLAAKELIANEAIEASQKATEAATKAHEAAAEAADKQREALAELADQLAGNTTGLLAAQSQQIKTNQALAEYDKTAQDASKSTDEQTLALNEMVTQVIDTASKTGEATVSQGHFATETDKASASIDAQIGYLSAVANTLAPGSPLRSQIEAYIGQLNGIKSNINTEVTANTEQALAALRALNNYINSIQGDHVVNVSLIAGSNASGGDVKAAASGADAMGGAYWVGEQGPELFVPGSDGHIFPANSKFGGAGKGGGGMVVNVYMPPGSDGDDVVRALKRYERRNGSVPIKTR